jgi:hypothetical protein
MRLTASLQKQSVLRKLTIEARWKQLKQKADDREWTSVVNQAKVLRQQNQ